MGYFMDYFRAVALLLIALSLAKGFGDIGSSLARQADAQEAAADRLTEIAEALDSLAYIMDAAVGAGVYEHEPEAVSAPRCEPGLVLAEALEHLRAADHLAAGHTEDGR